MHAQGEQFICKVNVSLVMIFFSFFPSLSFAVSPWRSRAECLMAPGHVTFQPYIQIPSARDSVLFQQVSCAKSAKPSPRLHYACKL